MSKKPIALILMLLMMVVGCSSAPADSTPSTDAAETASTEPAPEDQSLAPDAGESDVPQQADDSTPTHIPQVDAVINAYLEKDIDSLASCSMTQCEKDAEGTLQPHVVWGACQVNNLSSDWESVRSHYEGWVQGSRSLYAVYRVHESGDWAYFVQFAYDQNDTGAKSAVLAEDGKIMQLWMGCNVPGEMPADHYEPIIAPTVNQ